MKVYGKLVFIAIIICLVSAITSANASSPACHGDDISMYINSNTVVEAVVTKSRRWSEGGTLLHLVAKYKILDVFKGDVNKDEILVVTDTCLDEPIPREMLGYPVVEDYCRGGIGLRLTGVDSRNGKPVIRSRSKPGWILFLRKDIRRGAPQQTWLEVSRTGFDGCGQTLNDIPPDEREESDRLLRRLKNNETVLDSKRGGLGVNIQDTAPDLAQNFTLEKDTGRRLLCPAIEGAIEDPIPGGFNKGEVLNNEDGQFYSTCSYFKKISDTEWESVVRVTVYWVEKTEAEQFHCQWEGKKDPLRYIVSKTKQAYVDLFPLGPTSYNQADIAGEGLFRQVEPLALPCPSR